MGRKIGLLYNLQQVYIQYVCSSQEHLGFKENSMKEGTFVWLWEKGLNSWTGKEIFFSHITLTIWHMVAEEMIK
jgi:hypothetical protein